MTLFRDTEAVWGAMRACQSDETGTPDGYARMLSLCLDEGIDWIDHADIYDDGAVERLHGEAATRLSSEQRNRLRLITKCGVRFRSEGQPGVRLHHYRSDAAFIRDQAEASLKRLKAERIDLFLLHRPDYLMRGEETARALDDLVERGLVGAVGVSNFSAWQVDHLANFLTHPVAANQIELSPLETGALDDGRLDQARAQSFATLAWSPLGGSRLFAPESEADRRVDAVIRRLAEARGIDEIGAIALAWVAKTGAVPVLGTCRPDRLKAQLDGLRRAGLDAQDWYEILEAARGQRVP